MAPEQIPQSEHIAGDMARYVCAIGAAALFGFYMNATATEFIPALAMNAGITFSSALVMTAQKPAEYFDRFNSLYSFFVMSVKRAALPVCTYIAVAFIRNPEYTNHLAMNATQIFFDLVTIAPLTVYWNKRQANSENIFKNK